MAVFFARSRVDVIAVRVCRKRHHALRLGGSCLEFKSSFRWDLKQSCTNRQLENIVLKSLARFLNSHHGGTLFDGWIVGLENDFKTLKKNKTRMALTDPDDSDSG